MASAPVIDIDELLEPISEANPVGEDPREDPSPTSFYYQIKDARTSARAAERKALIDPDAEPADWRPLLDLVPQALKEKAKDLEFVAWYIEALARERGFAGLRDGFCLARRLCEKYFDSIYPLPDEDGLVARVAALTGLNGEDAEGTLVAPISAIPLTDHTSVGQFGAWQYHQALEIARIEDPEKRQTRIDQGATTMEDFERAVAETSDDFFLALHDDIQQAIDEFQLYSQKLDELCGSESPPTSSILGALTACRDVVQSVAKEVLARQSEAAQATEEAADQAAAADDQGQPAARTAATVAVGVGEIRNREDALKALGDIAEFFRRNEPHTPVTYLLQQSVRWGRMPLPDLLRELIPDSAARGTFFRLSGIPGEEAEGVIATNFAPLSAGQAAVPQAPPTAPPVSAPAQPEEPAQPSEPPYEEAPW